MVGRCRPYLASFHHSLLGTLSILSPRPLPCGPFLRTLAATGNKYSDLNFTGFRSRLLLNSALSIKGIKAYKSNSKQGRRALTQDIPAEVDW